jgi:hypothetical protein
VFSSTLKVRRESIIAFVSSSSTTSLVKLYLTMSTNLVRMFSGRKKESSVWRYFSYDDASDRSRPTCQVKTKDDKECGVKLAGKNPTNLKVCPLFCPAQLKFNISELSILRKKLMQYVFPFFNFMHCFCVFNVYLIMVYYNQDFFKCRPI